MSKGRDEPPYIDLTARERSDSGIALNKEAGSEPSVKKLLDEYRNVNRVQQELVEKLLKRNAELE